jgi:hypothetical protein
MLMITWGESIAGREERGLEVFNEAIGLQGRRQQEGSTEGFDVALMPGGPIEGYIAVRGTAAQLSALMEQEEFERNLIDASLVVRDLRVTMGYCNEGIARQMTMYQEAIGKVPQHA